VTGVDASQPLEQDLVGPAGGWGGVATMAGVLEGRAGLSPHMIGRSAALSQLRDLVDAAAVTASEVPSVALVAGEAGIGKTRLLRELVGGLPTSTLVLVGNGDPSGITRPFSLVSDLLRESVAGADAVAQATEQLRARVGERPAVLILEDLHWADAESVAVIDRLVAQPWPRAIVIGTYRPDDLSRRLPGGDLLSRLERRTTVERVHLDRLSRLEVTAFIAAVYQEAPSSSVIESLYNRTGGNPFFLEELLTCCGAHSAADLASTPLPWSLEEVVRRQLDGLEPVERKVVDVAAICTTSRFEVLSEVAGLEEHELIEVLRRLIDRNVLVETGDDRFAFRHALVRDAVENALLGRERRRLHERAFDALSLLGASPDELAHHALGAGRYGDVVELARQGAVAALAEGRSFSALRLADQALAEAPTDMGLLAIATEAAWLLGLVDEARSYATELRSIAHDDGDLEQSAVAVRWISRIHFEAGEKELENQALERLVELVGMMSPTEERARATAHIAQIHMLHDRDEEAVAWADRAIEEADAIGAKLVAARALIERGSALVNRDGVEAAPALLEAIDVAESLEQWVLVARGINNLYQVVPAFTPDGRLMYERFRRAARRAGFDAMVVASAALRVAQMAAGDADLPGLRAAIDRAKPWSLFGSKAGDIMLAEFELALEEGRVADARELLQGLQLDGVCDKDRTIGGAFRLSLDSLTGDTADAREALAMFADTHPTVDAWLVPRAFEAVDGALRAGVPVDEVRAEVRRWLGGTAAEERCSTLVEGLLAAGDGNHDAAAARLLTALAQPDPSMPRFLIGHLRTLAAEQVLASGDRPGAKALIDQAVVELGKWPGWRRDRAEALARRLEGAGAAGGELTTREREVAALLAEGLTNSELARRLFISPKTAAVHVSNILMKLNMSSRAEVAAWAVRSGVAADSLSP
jgi:DNA-binding CsgD family transcriptional regulator